MAEYLFSCIQEAIHSHIQRELTFLASYDKAKKSIQAIIDMPDKEIDLFIKFVVQNKGKLSGQKKNRFFSLLKEDEINNIVLIIRDMMITTNVTF